MKKNLSKVVVATLVLVAIASTMIFAGLVNKVTPKCEFEVRYTLLEDTEVAAFILNDRKIEVSENYIAKTFNEYDFAPINYRLHDNIMDTKVVVFGDANKDGKLNVLDASIMLKEIANKKTLTGEQKLVRNIANSNEVVNVLDVTRLLKFVVGNVDSVLEADLAEDELEITRVESTMIDGYSAIALEFNVNPLVIENMLPDARDLVLFDKNGNIVARDSRDEIRLIFPYEAPQSLELDEERGMVAVIVPNLPKGTYTLAGVDENDNKEYEVEVNINNIAVGNITVIDASEDELGTIDYLDAEHQLVTVTAEVHGVPTGAFTLTFTSYDKDEKVLGTKTVKDGVVNTGVVTFEEIDLSDLADGEVLVEVKYTEGATYASRNAMRVVKSTKILEVSDYEINRFEVEAVEEPEVRPAATVVNVRFELAEVADPEEVSAYAIILPYTMVEEKATKPETPEFEDLIEVGQIGLVGKTVELYFEVQDTVKSATIYDALNPEDPDDYAKLPSILFVVLENKAGNRTEVLKYDVPAPELDRVTGVIEAKLEDGVVEWLDGLGAKGIAGYRVSIFDAEENEVYTTRVSADTHKLNLLAELKELGVGTYSAAVRALGNGTTNLDAEVFEATGTTEIAELPNLPTVEFDEENTGKIFVTFEADMEDEDEVAEIDAIKSMKFYIVNEYAVGQLPRAEREALTIDDFDMGEVTLENGVISDDKDSITYTVDLTKHMKENGAYMGIFDILAKEDSLYVDSLYAFLEGPGPIIQMIGREDNVNTRVYLVDAIKSVDVKNFGMSVSVYARTEAQIANNMTLAYKAEGIDEIVKEGLDIDSPFNIENLQENVEYTLVVTALRNDIELDKATYTFEINGKGTLFNNDENGYELTKGDTFKVNKNKAGEVTSIDFLFKEDEEPAHITDLDSIGNLEEILAINEMLSDGDQFWINEDGKLDWVCLNSTDDPLVEDETTRTLVLDKKVLVDNFEICCDEDANIWTLVLEGTANDVKICCTPNGLVDISKLSAARIFMDDETIFKFEGDFEIVSDKDRTEYDAKEFETVLVEDNTECTIKDFAPVFKFGWGDVKINYNEETKTISVEYVS